MPKIETKSAIAARDKAGAKLENQFKPNKLGRLITVAASLGVPVSLYGFLSHIGSPEGDLWFGAELVSVGILTFAMVVSVHKKTSQESISNETGKSKLASLEEYEASKDRQSGL